MNGVVAESPTSSAFTLRLENDAGVVSIASGSLTNGFNVIRLAPGVYGWSTLTGTTVRASGQVTFVEQGFQVAGLYGDNNSNGARATFQAMPDGGVTGARSLVLFHGLLEERFQPSTPTMTFDLTGDGVPDTQPIASGESLTVDLPVTQTTVRVFLGTQWLDFPVPTTQTNGFPDGSRGAIVVRGLRSSYDPAQRAATRGLSTFDDPLTFTTRTDLPNPKLQFLNLSQVAGGVKKDLSVGGQLVAADAGFGSLSAPFSIPANTSISFGVQDTGTPLSSTSVGTQTLPAGAAGLVVFVTGYQLMRTIDSRSTSFGGNLATRSQEHQVVYAYPSASFPPLNAGTYNGSGLLSTIVQGGITMTPNVSLAPSAWGSTLSNLGIQEGTANTSYRIGGFGFSSRLAWTFYARLNAAGDRRLVRVSAPWTAYGEYRTDAVNVPCTQTGSTACTPCSGAACGCPAGVHGCP